MTDGAAFLWRSELAGHPRDTAAWRALYDYGASALPRPGAGLADLHVILTQAVMRDDAALDARTRQMEELAREGRYPSGSYLPELVARLRRVRTRRLSRGDRRARPAGAAKRTHRRQPRAARPDRVHAALPYDQPMQRPRSAAVTMKIMGGVTLNDRYDYIIVGAGSAGCVLANRLTESGQHTVLLLESGGRDTNRWIHIPIGFGKVMFDREVNWMFETEPEPRMNGRNIKVPRGRVLGGSSSINGLLYVRGQREDFDDWRDLGNPGWGYADCLPYFKKSEDQARGADDWHGVGGPLSVSDVKDRHPLADSFIEAGEAAGIPRNRDFNGASQEGVGYFQGTARKGLRCSAAVAYLRPAMRRSNLEVITHAHASRVLTTEKRATRRRVRRRRREAAGVRHARSHRRGGCDPVAAAPAALGHRSRPISCSATASASCMRSRASAAICTIICNRA